MERIVGKKNALLVANSERAQTVPAWPITCRDFAVRRMSVAWGMHAGTDEFGNFCGYRYNLKGRHGFRPYALTRCVKWKQR
jgi:hypothetical protein